MRAESLKLAAALAVAEAGTTPTGDLSGIDVRVRTQYPDKPWADSTYVGNFTKDDAHLIAGRLAAELGGTVERTGPLALLVIWGRKGQYLSIPQVVERTGLKETTVRTYKTKGLMPPPDAQIGGVPGWLVETIDEWKETLPGQGARNDLKVSE